MDTSLLDQLDAFGTGDFSSYQPPTNSQVSGMTFPSSSGINYGEALTAGSDVLGGIGSLLQGQETQMADEYNANLAIQQGQFNVEQLNVSEVSTLSTQRAAYAKAGVMQSGSVLDTALATATQFEYSKDIATYNAQSQANMDNYLGKEAKSQGEMGFAGGLLKAANSLL